MEILTASMGQMKRTVLVQSDIVLVRVLSALLENVLAELDLSSIHLEKHQHATRNTILFALMPFAQRQMRSAKSNRIYKHVYLNRFVEQRFNIIIWYLIIWSTVLLIHSMKPRVHVLLTLK